MESKPGDSPSPSLGQRFTRRWFPLAVVVGGVGTLTAGALRTRPEPGRPGAPPGTLPGPAPPEAADAQAVPAVQLPRVYVLAGTVGRDAAPLRQSLLGIATDAADQLYALGDGEVRVYGPDGHLLRHWRVAETAESLGVGPDGRVYVGGAGRVDIFDSSGRVGGFAFGDARAPASVSAVKVFKSDILVADASARIIRRFDASGRQLGLIGDQNKTKAFILPNGKLDLDIDAAGVVRATDTGRHQVTAWALDGTPIGKFGKFGMSDPADFVGCCNPMNVATTPDGKVVTSEKMVARVKVYEPDGRLLALIGSEHFDPMCTQIRLAVDSKGRLFAADPVRREIKVFVQTAKEP